jgi:hypothetical protein
MWVDWLEWRNNMIYYACHSSLDFFLGFTKHRFDMNQSPFIMNLYTLAFLWIVLFALVSAQDEVSTTTASEVIPTATDSCPVDSSVYGWDTSKDNGYFAPLSFKFGLYYGLQMTLLAYQFHYFFKKAAAKFPFLIQLSWTMTNVFYVLNWYRPHEPHVIFSYIFDALTKVMVIYFICIRLIVTTNIQTKMIKQMSIFLFVSGIIFSILVNVPQVLMPYYQIADFYISLIEILSLYLYIYTKFKCTTVKDVGRTIKQLQLTNTTLMVFLSAFLSALTAVLEQSSYGIDYDYMFNATLTAIKYATSCDLAFVVFQKTLGGSSKNTSAHSQLKSMQNGTINSPVGANTNV